VSDELAVFSLVMMNVNMRLKRQRRRSRRGAIYTRVVYCTCGGMVDYGEGGWGERRRKLCPQ